MVFPIEKWAVNFKYNFETMVDDARVYAAKYQSQSRFNLQTTKCEYVGKSTKKEAGGFSKGK